MESLDLSSKMSRVGLSGNDFVAEGASIYAINDERYRLYAQHLNPVIENELVKHKVSIEELFMESEMNRDYVFLRVTHPSKRISVPEPET